MNVCIHPDKMELSELQAPDLGIWPVLRLREGSSRATVHLTEEKILKLKDILNAYTPVSARS